MSSARFPRFDTSFCSLSDGFIDCSRSCRHRYGCSRPQSARAAHRIRSFRIGQRSLTAEPISCVPAGRSGAVRTRRTDASRPNASAPSRARGAWGQRDPTMAYRRRPSVGALYASSLSSTARASTLADGAPPGRLTRGVRVNSNASLRSPRPSQGNRDSGRSLRRARRLELELDVSARPVPAARQRPCASAHLLVPEAAFS